MAPCTVPPVKAASSARWPPAESRYADMDEAIRALLCFAGGARAAEAAGQQAVRDVLRPALAQFQDPRTGTVTLRNTFRWVAARS